MFCGRGQRRVGGNGQSVKANTPLLLHFDVNKTIIQSDSIQMKSIEEGVREGISELFWGKLRKDGDKVTWEWSRAKPSCSPPTDDVRHAGETLKTYQQYVKQAIKDKQQQKAAVRSFSLVEGLPVRAEMDKLLQLTLKRMQLPAGVRHTKEAMAAGIQGTTYNMFPTLFHLAANLQRSNRPFAVIFRSFGADHENIKTEWNAFCELRHPVFSSLIEDLGPMDGSVAGIPDRRIHGLHTLYRDSTGPILILNTFTNGPPEATWDSWAKQKPRAKTDTRNGREYIDKVLKAKTVEGLERLRKWMKEFLFTGGTTAIKDDWAWWQWNGEQASAGKLMTVLGGKPATSQLFYDDNIDHDDARIVDVRDLDGKAMPREKALHKLCVKVNPVEALLDDDYFYRKLMHSQGDHLDVGASLMGLQKQLTDAEEERTQLHRQLHAVNEQLKTLTEENRRMKLQRRIPIRDEGELQTILTKGGVDFAAFEKGGFRSLADLYAEIDAGQCWLEYNQNNQVVRILDMVFLNIIFGDKLLVEGHEQDSSGRVTSRNYMPGIQLTLKDSTVQAALDRWLANGLGVNLKRVVEPEMMPVSTPEAPPQQTGSSQAYPILTRIEQSTGTFVIPDKEVELNKEILAKIGLPGGKHFTTEEKDFFEGTVTRFWRWDSLRTFQAAAAGKAGGNLEHLNVAETCEKLFKGHPRADTYKKILLEMFDSFEAQKLCGGFSGSVVIRVQPFEPDGRKGEPCIVKLDAGEAIAEEFVNSVNVFEALPDRAARILGDAVYANTDKGERLGAMRLELAGACWNVPELAQGSTNLLSTFKDLLLYEGEQVFLGMTADTSTRPFGNVNSVLAETFGPGGVVSSLRKGGAGLRRHDKKPLLWGWYTLKGKEGKFNPYTAKKGEFPPEQAMRRLYKEHFGGEWPDLKDVVQNKIKPKLEQLASKASIELMPLVGLAHGDLNAANIMIDALDAVWLIDFATSVELPLFMDMCKFEMASLFEYAIIPVTPKVFLDFCSTNPEMWEKMNVGDWLRADQAVVQDLLQKFVALNERERLHSITESDLHKLIEEVVTKSGKRPDKQKMIQRALQTRLCADPAQMDAALSYCGQISNMLLQGDFLLETLQIRGIELPEGRGSRGALSLRFFMDLCVSVRKFMAGDIAGVLREQAKMTDGLQPVDNLSLQLYLPFLRETYRILGYRDIAPQYKIWSMYHCKKVAEKVESMLQTIQKNQGKLAAMGMLNRVRQELDNRMASSQGPAIRQSDTESLSTASHWVLQHATMFPQADGCAKLVRTVHQADSNRDMAGIFSPIWEVKTVDNVVIPLEFVNNYDGGKERSSSMQNPDLCIWDPDSTGPVRQRIVIGQVIYNKKEPQKVVMSSRLFRMHLEHLKDVLVTSPKKGSYPSSNFKFDTWSNGIIDEASLYESTKRTSSPKAEDLGQIQALQTFMTFEAFVADLTGREVLKVRMELGIPIYCYPPGSRLTLDTTQEQVAGDSFLVIAGFNKETGCYITHTEAEFDPTPANHVFPPQASYPLHSNIILKAHENAEGWLDAEVLKLPTKDSGFKYELKLKTPSEKQTMIRFLDPLTSAQALQSMTALSFEEEIHKIKAFFRARYSFVIDALSGSRLNVKECAPPTLSLKTDSGMMQMGQKGNAHMRGSSHPGVASIVAQGSGSNSGSEGGGGINSKFGWPTVLASLESFEKGAPSCHQNAFLVLGSPGSGKTCLICRVIMETLDRYSALVPLLIPVADLVKRSGQDLDLSEPTRAVSMDWFDRYLRMTYGEDSNRYWMIIQAMQMKRVAFLFEGLEDGGALMKPVECAIKNIILDGHFCIVTSRPLLGGESSLEEMSEYILALKLENLSDEHKRAVARKRLGAEGFDAFEKLFKKLREGQQTTEAQTEGGELADREKESEQDVFGNPMMLSMLLCYLQTMQNKQDEARGEDGSPEGGDGGATLTAVYRVALDVMLQRVQSRQMAERMHRDKKVEESKKILEKMSLQMQLTRRVEIPHTEVEKLISKDQEQVWMSLHQAVTAGHAMFLRLSQDSGTVQLKFLVKGFQNYFAAQAVANGSDKDLPGLQELLTDPWWAQMLEMLAEANPKGYIHVIESRLGSFKPQEGETFLHIAARAGHRPIFQLLKLLQEPNRQALWEKSTDKRTPLHVAAEKGNTALCEMMLEANALVDAEDAHERLAMHVAMQHGAFQTARFLMQRWNDHMGKDAQYRRKRRSDKAEQLAIKVLAGTQSELNFKDGLKEAFPELQYFSEKEHIDHSKTLGALLAVYWITDNHYDLFVRPQKGEIRLTRRSWDTLQEWTIKTVGLKKSPQMVGAMLVFVAIMNLGKIKPFQKAFAPDLDEPTAFLHHILQKYPLVIPSFSNLTEEMQHMILSALKADFNFGQFLQAENLPASLSTVKQILGEDSRSKDILGLFLFKYFAAMCGILGMKSLEGSMFMTDTLYKNFKVGLDSLSNLMNHSAEEVYDKFLAERAKAQCLNFSSYNPEDRARVRLACLTRALNAEDGQAVSDAITMLDHTVKKQLLAFVNVDGITEKPAFLLYNSPNLLSAGYASKKIGLTLAMKVMLRVYQAAAAEYTETEKSVVSVFVDELAEYIKNPAVDAEMFEFVKFEIVRTAGAQGDSQGSVHISPWQLVTDQKVIDNLAEEGNALSRDVLRSGMREPGFLKRLQSVFPELSFMTGSDVDEGTKTTLKETLCALLVVYWTASDQVEAFTRGQPADVKLSERSWTKVQDMMSEGCITEESVLSTVFVVMALHALGKIKKFRQQLAPDAEGSRQVLAHVLDTCPKVLPSYNRLDPKMRAMARECLTRDFNFAQFLCAELVPASIKTIKEMATVSNKKEQHYLPVFLYCLFAEMAASMGPQSLDGSLYMNEAKWAEVQCAWEAMTHLETESEQDIYNRILRRRAETLGLSFQKGNAEQYAITRLACLCRVTELSVGKKIEDAFAQLSNAERTALTKYLGMDGLTQKPAFILTESSNFLENCLVNGEVGMLPALKILLKVYQAAEKEFRSSSRAVVSIKLNLMADFAKNFGGSVTFQDVNFDTVKNSESEATCVPKMWIPVTNPAVLTELEVKGRQLAKQLLQGGISERQFKVAIVKAFPELSYFPASAEAQKWQTYGAMLSVLWLLGGLHEAFIRQQPEEEQLSKQNWAWIQEWMKEHVKIGTEEAVDAILTFMAIHALGKIPEFRDELAPGFDATGHDIALSHILKNKPEVVPSFSRLPPKYRSLIVDSLSVDFQFNQLLQAENVPANLEMVKEQIGPHGDEGYAFFCFRIFVQMCGKLGQKGLAGSLFMTEQQFQRFRPGLDALQNLKTKEAGTAYNAYLLLQGSKALSRFASPEHQALARLLCLGSASDHASGDAVRQAFEDLSASDKAALTRWLIADGIQHKPGYVLCSAPDLLRNAQANPAVGLTEALQMMVRVQERCDVATSLSLRPAMRKVYVHLKELASWAQDAGSLMGEFKQARLEVRSEDLGDTRVFSVQVIRPKRNMSSSQNSSDRGCCQWICDMLRCLVQLSFLMAAVASGAGAYLLHTHSKLIPDEVLEQLDDHELTHKKAAKYSAALSMLLLFLLMVWCCWRRCFSCLCGGSSCEDCGSCRTCACGGNGCFGALGRAGYARLESDLI